MSRGLAVPDPVAAERDLERIGYERLRIYFLSRRHRDRPGKPFDAGTSLDDILALYRGDARLRQACFAAVGQFEIVLRNRMSEVLSRDFGSHPYSVSAAFEDADCQRKAMRDLLSVFARSRDTRADHYRTIYTEPPLPPIWMMKELMTFGTAARFYGTLAEPVRTRIAEDLGVSVRDVLDSWIPAFVDLRNVCAHHDRLFNRRFQKQPKRLHRAGIPSGDPALLRAQAECLDHVLAATGFGGTLVAEVNGIVTGIPPMSPAEAGF